MSTDRDGLPILTLPGQTKNSMLMGKTDIRVSSRRQGKRP